MALSREDLKADLVGRLGDPTDEEVPDAQLERALSQGIRDLNRFTPVMLSGRVTLDLVPGTNTYPLPVGVTGVSDLWLLPTGVLFAQIVDPYDLLRTGLPHEAFAQLEKLGLTRTDMAIWDHQLDTTVSPPMLTIQPVPQRIASLLVTCTRDRLLSDCTEEHQLSILDFAQSHVCTYLAQRRAMNSVRSLPTPAGVIRFDDAAALRQMAKDLWQAGAEGLGGSATTIDIG